MFKIYVCMAILCINLYENEADNTTAASKATIPKLDFWTPDPKFNDKFFANRRRMQDAAKDSKIYYRHGRGNLFARRVENKNSSQKFREKLQRGRLPVDQIDHRSRPLDPPGHRTSDEDVTVWPRAKRGRHKSRHGGTEEGVSTRLTPMYLMQQNEEEPATTTSRSSTAEAEESYLSPYSLERQIQKMLSAYDDVNASIDVIGRTVEYNNILLVKLSERNTDIGKYFRAEDSKYIEEVPEKKIVFIVHGLSVMGIHSLTNLNNYIHFRMLLYYYVQQLKAFDIFLIPMANPDGYSAAGKKSFWNKNMSPQSACQGVALDRNFDVAWNTAKEYSSCSQLYPGPAPFSEAETKAIRDVFHQYGHKIAAYIHVHSGTPSADVFKGDAVLYPKGFTEIQSDDDKYIDLRGEIDEMMKNASFRVMSVTVDTLHNWYGKVYGSSVDYASTVYGIPYALEFVMQIYKSSVHDTDSSMDWKALTVIWERVIDVVFENMWKNLHANDVK